MGQPTAPHPPGWHRTLLACLAAHVGPDPGAMALHATPALLSRSRALPPPRRRPE